MIALTRFDWLGERRRPHAGMLALWVLLGCAAGLCAWLQMHWTAPPPGSERTGLATVLSFLPDTLLLNRFVFAGCGVLFFASSLPWAAQRWLPWSSWLSVLSFTAVAALYLENSTQATHVAHVANVLLVVCALWSHFYRRDIRDALNQGRFWATPLYPRWARSASVFYLGLFYGFSGLTKLRTSGWSWPNGVSMQLWSSLWGDPGSPWTQLILEHRSFAAALQWGALLLESAGLAAIFSARLRPWIGVGLIGFHIGQISVFGWGFHGNLAAIALFFLPVDAWTTWLVDRLERKQVGQSPGVGNKEPVPASCTADKLGSVRVGRFRSCFQAVAPISTLTVKRRGSWGLRPGCPPSFAARTHDNHHSSRTGPCRPESPRWLVAPAGSGQGGGATTNPRSRSAGPSASI